MRIFISEPLNICEPANGPHDITNRPHDMANRPQEITNVFATQFMCSQWQNAARSF